MNESLLVTIREASRIVGCSHWSVRGAIWDGTLPFYPLGRRHMVRRADLERWLDSLRECNGTGTNTGTKKNARASLAVSRN